MALLAAAVDVLVESQTEIIIFLIAVCAHSLLFGKHPLYPPALAAKKVPSTVQGKSGGQKASQSPRGQNGAHAVFVRAVATVASKEASSQKIENHIAKQLKACASGVEVEALESLLGSLGKSLSAEILEAVRGVIEKQSLQPSMRLNEHLLRGYLALRLLDQFFALLAAVESTGAAPPSIKALAMRAAIQSADFEVAAAYIPGIASAWKVGAGSTPSVAHQHLLQQLVRLAAEKSVLPRLLQELRACDLLNAWALEAVLVECAKRGDAMNLREFAGLARSQGMELTVAAHAALVRGAASAASALQAFEEACARKVAGDDLLLAGAQGAAKFGSRALAEAVVKRLPPRATPALACAVLRLAAKSGPLAKKSGEVPVELFLRHFQGVDLSEDLGAQRAVADAALQHGRTDVLAHLVMSLPEGSSRMALFKSFAAEGRLDYAGRIFQACREKTACFYNAYLDVCIDCQDLRAAEGVMSEAIAASLADVVTYNTMIKAYLQKDQLPRARETMRAMRKAGLEPNCVTFNEFLDAAVKCNLGGAWELLEEMRACGLKPNQVTCSILLKSIQKCARPSDVERALAVVESMDEGMDEVLLSSVCEACIRSNRADLLAKQLDRQHTSRAVQVKGAHTYGSLIRSYGFVQDLAGAWETWREMRVRHVQPTSVTLGCMVEALASNGQPEAGYDLIRDIAADPQTRPLVNAVIYCSVLKGFSHQKRFERVWAVYEEMVSERLQFSIVTYNTLIDACARNGAMHRITKFLEEMSRQNIEPNVITYSTVLKGYCQENRLDKAFEVLADMKKSTQFSPDEVTYNTLLDGCARYGMFDKGVALLDDMLAAGVHPSNFTLSVLVKLANRSKKPAKAFELCDELSRKYHIRLNIHVYNNLVHACTAHGNLDRALGVLESMLAERVRPDTRTYTLLLRYCVGAGEGRVAAGLLRAAAGLHDGHPRLSRFGAAAAQPKGGLPADLVSEAIEGVAGACGDEPLALELVRDLRRTPSIAVDPKLPMRLASRAIRAPGKH